MNDDLMDTLRDILDPQCGKELEAEAQEAIFFREWIQTKDFEISLGEARTDPTFEKFQESMQKSWQFWLKDRWDDYRNSWPGKRRNS